jgi:hypothetical protein
MRTHVTSSIFCPLSLSVVLVMVNDVIIKAILPGLAENANAKRSLSFQRCFNASVQWHKSSHEVISVHPFRISAPNTSQCVRQQEYTLGSRPTIMRCSDMRLVFNHGESRVDFERIAGTRLDTLLSTYKPALPTVEGASHVCPQNLTTRRGFFVHSKILLMGLYEMMFNAYPSRNVNDRRNNSQTRRSSSRPDRARNLSGPQNRGRSLKSPDYDRAGRQQHLQHRPVHSRPRNHSRERMQPLRGQIKQPYSHVGNRHDGIPLQSRKGHPSRAFTSRNLSSSNPRMAKPYGEVGSSGYRERRHADQRARAKERSHSDRHLRSRNSKQAYHHTSRSTNYPTPPSSYYVHAGTGARSLRREGRQHRSSSHPRFGGVNARPMASEMHPRKVPTPTWVPPPNARRDDAVMYGPRGKMRLRDERPRKFQKRVRFAV